MHAKPDLRVVLEWMIARSGSVITDVMHHTLTWKRNILDKTYISELVTTFSSVSCLILNILTRRSSRFPVQDSG